MLYQPLLARSLLFIAGAGFAVAAADPPRGARRQNRRQPARAFPWKNWASNPWSLARTRAPASSWEETRPAYPHAHALQRHHDREPRKSHAPGDLSTAGFLGKNEKLLDVLAADNQLVLEQLRQTHQELAWHLRVLGAIGEQAEKPFTYQGGQYKVIVNKAGGSIDPLSAMKSRPTRMRS